MLLRTIFAITLPFGLCAAFGTACLPTYTGAPPAEDLSTGGDPNHVDTPPSGNPDPVVPADLAGTVTLSPDMFVSSGASTITLDSNTATLHLNESKNVVLTITPNGVTGSATLALLNAPAGLTATFNPATVTLGTAAVTSTMTLTSAGDMTAVSSIAATVQLTAGAQTSTTTLGISVLQELFVTIAAGVATSNNPTAFGAAAIPVTFVAPGTKVTFVNNDTIQHRIHADGTGGIAHEPNNMAAAGGTYTQTINATGDISFYCHIHPGMKGKISVK